MSLVTNVRALVLCSSCDSFRSASWIAALRRMHPLLRSFLVVEVKDRSASVSIEHLHYSIPPTGTIRFAGVVEGVVKSFPII